MIHVLLALLAVALPLESVMSCSPTVLAPRKPVAGRRQAELKAHGSLTVSACSSHEMTRQ